MEGWKLAIVSAAIAALFSIFTAALFGQDEKIDQIRQRVIKLEAQHQPPPHGHSPR